MASPHPEDSIQVDPVAMNSMYHAHDQASQAAATAAAFMRLGESLHNAVHDAEVVLNAAGAVDADCSKSSLAPPDTTAASAPPSDTTSQLPSPAADLAVDPLKAPNLEVVRDALLTGIEAQPPPTAPIPAASVSLRAAAGMANLPDGPSSVRDSILSIAGSVVTPSLGGTIDEGEREQEMEEEDGGEGAPYLGSPVPTLSSTTCEPPPHLGDAPSHTSGHTADSEALLSMAAHMLGLSTTDKVTTAGTEEEGPVVGAAPAVAVGGTGLGAHSGDAHALTQAVAAESRDVPVPSSSPALPPSPHPSLETSDQGVASAAPPTALNLGRCLSGPLRPGSITPGRTRLSTQQQAANATGQLIQPGTPQGLSSATLPPRLNVDLPTSAPPSMCGFPAASSSGAAIKRPPTPPPSRTNTTLPGRARSSASSHRSGTSSPMHSARSQASLDELWAVEEEDYVERANSLLEGTDPLTGAGYSLHGMCPVSEEEGGEENGHVLPEWYQASSVGLGPGPGGEDDLSMLTTRGSVSSGSRSGGGAGGGSTCEASEHVLGKVVTPPAASGVGATVLETSLTGSVVGAAGGSSGVAGAGLSAHTGVPQLDEEPDLAEEIQDMKEQLALHGYVNRAAALAGALVHAGHHTPSQAVNLAEAAMDPADVIDFVDARTNLVHPDTVPDLLAQHASAHPVPSTAPTPTPTPAASLSRPLTPPAGASSATTPSISGAAATAAQQLLPVTEAAASTAGAATATGVPPSAFFVGSQIDVVTAGAPATADDTTTSPQPALQGPLMAALCAEVSHMDTAASDAGSGSVPSDTTAPAAPAAPSAGAPRPRPATPLEQYSYEVHGSDAAEEILEHEVVPDLASLSKGGRAVAHALPQRLDSELGGVTPAASLLIMNSVGLSPTTTTSGGVTPSPGADGSG